MNRFYKKMHSKNKHAKDKKSSNYKTKANVKAKETMTVEQQTALDLRSRIRQSNMCLNPSSNVSFNQQPTAAHEQVLQPFASVVFDW